MIKKNCRFCNNNFTTINSRKLYCSKSCKDKYHLQTQKPNTICDYCGKHFFKKEAKKKHNILHHCSKECHNKSMKKTEYKYFTCLKCNSIFKKKRRHQLKNKKHPFCSKQCANSYNGKKQRGANHHNFNENLTDEERIRKRDTYENIKWRRLIFKRDNYKCTVCNKKGHLNAHHIENYSSNKEKRYDMNNGITLCKECHYNFHKTYGYSNNNQKQLNEFSTIHHKNQNINNMDISYIQNINKQ